MPPSRPKFAVDEMLGTLARWLRIMGYDAEYDRDRNDDEIVESAKAQSRILLTRDRELAGRMGEMGLFIISDKLDQQLQQVWRAFALNPDLDSSRCTVCNGELEPMAVEDAKKQVPDGVLLMNQEFFRCRSCGKVYWRGTHWLNIKKKLAAMDPNQSL